MSYSPTLRYIIENTTPRELAITALTDTNDAFKIFFTELGKSTIESQFNELCLRLSIREVRLAKKMWDTIKLYGVVVVVSNFSNENHSCIYNN